MYYFKSSWAFSIFISAVSSCLSILAFASLVGVLAGIGSSEVGLEIDTLTARIKRYKSIIKKKRKKYDEIVLLAKNTIKVFVSKALIDPYIDHEEFASVNNV